AGCRLGSPDNLRRRLAGAPRDSTAIDGYDRSSQTTTTTLSWSVTNMPYEKVLYWATLTGRPRTVPDRASNTLPCAGNRRYQSGRGRIVNTQPFWLAHCCRGS